MRLGESDPTKPFRDLNPKASSFTCPSSTRLPWWKSPTNSSGFHHQPPPRVSLTTKEKCSTTPRTEVDSKRLRYHSRRIVGKREGMNEIRWNKPVTDKNIYFFLLSIELEQHIYSNIMSIFFNPQTKIQDGVLPQL